MIGYVSDHARIGSITDVVLRRPLIGGVFADAPQKWPSIFSGSFWESHHYAVPSFICAALTLVSLASGMFFLEEVSRILLTHTAGRRGYSTNKIRHTLTSR